MYVLGATLLRGLKNKGAKPRTGAKMLQKLVDAGDEAGASYFVAAACYAIAKAKRERLIDEPGGIARLLPVRKRFKAAPFRSERMLFRRLFLDARRGEAEIICPVQEGAKRSRRGRDYAVREYFRRAHLSGRFPHRLLRRAAECGHVRALCELATMHEDGFEVRKDGPEAARLLELAASADFLDAKRALARMHIDGQYVSRDPERAARLMGLDRTADLWKDGRGPRPPSFLFRATPPGAEGPGDGAPRDEYDDEEIDAFLNTDS